MPIVSVVLLLLASGTVAEVKKTKTAGQVEFNPSGETIAQRHRDLSDEELCIGCHATVHVVDQTLARAGRSIMTLTDTLDNFGSCTIDSFKVYDLIPPKMVNACKRIVDMWGEVEEVEAALLRGEKGDSDDGAHKLRELVCHEVRIPHARRAARMRERSRLPSP